MGGENVIVTRPGWPSHAARKQFTLKTTVADSSVLPTMRTVLAIVTEPVETVVGFLAAVHCETLGLIKVKKTRKMYSKRKHAP
jgi:hypothetical protein